jgi:hypothetical protein
VPNDVIDLDAALGAQFLDIAVGQAKAQVTADGEDDHVGWEVEAGEGGPRGPEQHEGGGGFSCRQSRRWNAVTANATAPIKATSPYITLRDVTPSSASQHSATTCGIGMSGGLVAAAAVRRAGGRL